MKKEFALDPGGPKRLTVTYAWNLANAEVSLDGQRIASFATKEDFQRGTTCKLPDGSLLTVRYGPIQGAAFLKGVHAVRNGAPLSGSATDPIPAWAWVFLIACGIIPIISLGGAVPALIAVAGVRGTLSVARLNRWSVGLRAGACVGIALACWGSFGMLIMALRPTTPAQATGWHVPFTKAIFMSSSPDKLFQQIDEQFTLHGYNEKAISGINETLHKQCDMMTKRECVDYLRAALLEAENRHKD
jgi:hypothetical protein